MEGRQAGLETQSKIIGKKHEKRTGRCKKSQIELYKNHNHWK